MIRPARSTALAALMLCAASLTAFAQAPAPREIPKDFVLPGPAPSGGPAAMAPVAPVAPVPPITASPGAPPAPAPMPMPSTGSAAPAQTFVIPGGASTTRLATGGSRTHDWPCVQRRIDHVDERQVWTGPDLDTAGAAPRNEAMRELVATLAQRRVPLPEAEAKAKAFVDVLPQEARGTAATAIFADLFARLNAERSQIMRGIERYGAKQQDLAVKLREEIAALSALRSGGDAEKAAAVQEALLWDTRIFEERRRSLTYVCEVPTLIEQRLFALGRALGTAL